MDLTTINSLPKNEFLHIFSNVVEKYPACAFFLERHRPYANLSALLTALDMFLTGLSHAEVEKILLLHPDLAGKIADESDLTEDSVHEQRAAGLRTMTSEETELLKKMNEKYKEKFGFPFIICARENKTDAILNGLASRLSKNIDDERCTAFLEVKKISTHRINNLIKN